MVKTISNVFDHFQCVWPEGISSIRGDIWGFSPSRRRCESNKTVVFVLHWLLRSSPHAPHDLIEIIRPLFKTTVLIYSDERPRPWPCSALTRIAAPAPSKVSPINSGFSFGLYFSFFVVVLKSFLFSYSLGFPFDICSVRKENPCKQCLSQQINNSVCSDWPALLIT